MTHLSEIDRIAPEVAITGKRLTSESVSVSGVWRLASGVWRLATYTRDVEHFWVQKKVHWSDADPAGIVWFPNFFGWFEDAEEEIYTATLGRSRQALLDALSFGMPRVEAHAKYTAPVRPGQTIRIGIRSTLENPRRLRHDFEMRDEGDVLIAEGFVRVACVDLATFKPRDLPNEVLAMARALPAAAKQQMSELPWV